MCYTEFIVFCIEDSDSSGEESGNEDKSNGKESLEGEPIFLVKRKEKMQQMEKSEGTKEAEEEVDYRTDEEKREDAVSTFKQYRPIFSLFCVCCDV